jgi:histidine triad (HIT) family protein
LTRGGTLPLHRPMSEPTLFQRIASHQIPAHIIAETGEWIAFHDIAPQAPVHFLVVPKHPHPRLAEVPEDAGPLLGRLLLAAAALARQLGLETGGYRVTINNGRDGGESVPHLHLHVLGGRPLGWPPG